MNAIAERLEIQDLLDRETNDLDVAETRMVNLARALIARPKLLMIDAILESMSTEQRERILGAISAGQSVYDVAEGAGDDIIASSSNIRGSSDRLDQILAELQTLTRHARLIVQRLDSGTEELPDLISEGHSLIKNTNEITDRLSNHWLLGGDATEESVRPLPGLHPNDPEAYDAATDTTAPGRE